MTFDTSRLTLGQSLVTAGSGDGATRFDRLVSDNGCFDAILLGNGQLQIRVLSGGDNALWGTAAHTEGVARLYLANEGNQIGRAHV
mgnify:FL=1